MALLTLTADTLSALRLRVAGESPDSPATLLLVELDAREAAEQERIREDSREVLRSQGLTHGEVERVLAHLDAGNDLEYVEGPCRNCEGTGTVMEMGCIGYRTQECHMCYGNGTNYGIKVPECPIPGV